MPKRSGTGSKEVQYDALKELSSRLLTTIGEDAARPGLQQTPHRFAKMMLEVTSGYDQDVEKIVNGAIFDEPYSQMVVVRSIEFYSLCEHHMLPFFGKAHVAYIPQGKIVGLSKIPRIVRMFAQRLQVQERLTQQITSALQELLQPAGVACLMEAQHLCMMMRGAEIQSSTTVTNAMTGDFLSNAATRDEFMRIARG